MQQQDAASIARLRELVAGSRRVAAVPGLHEQARAWQRELPAVRRELDRQARLLARPRLWPDTLGALAGTAGRVARTAAPDAPLALLSAAASASGLPVAPPSSSRATVERAERLVRASGPAYVKLGQFIASSRGLLPDAWVDAFAWCTDDAPRLPDGVARSVVERELGPDALVDLDDEPLAAGSIGQVHTARLPDGTRVVVKVRRPGLRRRFRRDVETLALVAAGADRWLPTVRSANLPGFVELFAHLSLHELDFRHEALNAVEAAAVVEHAGIDAVTVPLPFPGLVTERVLVMPFVAGVPYDRVGDVDGEALLHTAIHAVLASTLLYGVSHGDLHAGNVLVPAPDRFNLLDYGICARLATDQRTALIRYLAAFATSDTDGQVDALVAFGAFDGADLTRLRRELAVEVEALERRDGGEVTYDKLGVTLGRVLRVFAAHRFTMPAELVLFFKNLLYLSSFAAAVGPEVDLLDAVVGVVLELAEAHPEEFAAAEPEEQAVG